MPALSGDSSSVNQAAVTGSNNAPTGGNGVGVFGTSTNGEGVHGETNSTTFAAATGLSLNRNATGGAGVWGHSEAVEGVHGQTNSTKFAGVTGVSLNKNATAGAGVWGYSEATEGVHGETNSTTFAAATGLSLNKNATGGAGVWGHSEAVEGVHGQTNSTKFAAVAGYELNPASTAAAVFGLNSGTGAGVFGTSKGYEGVHGETTSNTTAAVGAINKGTTGAGFYGISQGGEGVHGETNSTTAAGVAGYALNPNGSGIGVYGESRGLGPAGFFKGNVMVTGDVVLTGADCAEQFEIIETDSCDPGTVMVIDDGGALVRSDQAYDRRVAGVVAGAGDLRPGIILGNQSVSDHRRPIALVGKVYCNVDAQYGPVRVGDLLTTSPTPGHAMRATVPSKAFGAVIGKALRPLESGQALLPILIALQ